MFEVDEKENSNDDQNNPQDDYERLYADYLHVTNEIASKENNIRELKEAFSTEKVKIELLES